MPHLLRQFLLAVAVVLLASYAAGLLFSLKTHAHLFNPSHDEDDHGDCRDQAANGAARPTHAILLRIGCARPARGGYPPTLRIVNDAAVAATRALPFGL